MQGKRILRSTAMRGIAVYALVAVILTVLFSVMVFENQLDLITENAYLRSVQAGLRLREQVELAAVQSPEWVSEIEDLFRESEETDAITVFTGSGDILVSFGRTTEQTTDDELLLIHRAITRRDFESRLITHVLDEESRTVDLYVPFEYPQARIGVLNIRIEMVSIAEWTRVLNRQAAVVGIIVMLVHTALALFAHRLFIAPLKDLVRATTSIAGGDYDVRLPERRDDEFGDLARSFRQMSHAVRQMHDDARSSNPLSGLPGNVEIERHIRHRMRGGGNYCILYCDIDDFKVFNDTYGFALGDEMILFVRDCIVKAASKSATLPVFVGHEGGDDFVAVTDYSDWEAVARTAIDLFEAGKGEYYPAEVILEGHLYAEDRRGNLVKHPVAALSIGVVSNTHRTFESFGQLARVAADMKRLVKSTPGSTFAIDRRDE